MLEPQQQKQQGAEVVISEKIVEPVRFKLVRTTVNGVNYSQVVESRLLLVHLIREKLGLTGTHVGCDTSNCGACTVIFNGRSVKSCSMLAVQADGAEILTVEGLSREDGKLHPIQEEFWKNHALQCGFCTPGLIMEAYWFLKENENPTEDEVRHGIAGNLCRCTGYQNIVKAILAASKSMNSGKM